MKRVCRCESERGQRSTAEFGEQQSSRFICAAPLSSELVCGSCALATLRYGIHHGAVGASLLLFGDRVLAA